MVEETATWLHTIGLLPDLVQHTSTRRTEQTADTLIARLPQTSREIIREAPELKRDWEQWSKELQDRPSPPETVLLVGHHPTVEMILQTYGPAPTAVSRHHFAVGLLLESGENGTWTITHAWPGRSSLS
jgi:phosphohistidine phosphatase SixA